ncbi:MAG TPA: hypothetical protein VHE60_02470 [Pyrinomonadaceae bacterium]|nr:hypothetical protein [Pyrinomonadaceae bacterium]
MSIATKFRRLVNLYKLAWAGDRLDQLETQLNLVRGELDAVNAMVGTAVAELQSQVDQVRGETARQVDQVRGETARIESQVKIVTQEHEDLTRTVLTRAIAFRTKRLIVFLTPGYEWRAGGVLSIAAIYQESAALRHLHRARVVLCTVPGDPLLLKYTWFENNNYMLDLESVLKRCRHLDYLLLHIPEYAVNQVTDWLTSASPTLVQNVRELHLNVMLQNIDLVQGQNVSGLMRFGRVTCTTAHEAYTNSATREALGVSVHRLSVCTGPECYSLSGYQEKEPLLVVSHDEHPLKEQVLLHIAQAFPDLRIQVVQNLHYEDYRKLIRRAKWSLTFGEGLDAYFVEQVWSGGVAFAVFNDRYFTPAFAELETVYPSWEVLMDMITTDIQRLDEPVAYTRCWRQAYDLARDLGSIDWFRENLRKFYRGEYTFP